MTAMIGENPVTAMIASQEKEESAESPESPVKIVLPDAIMSVESVAEREEEAETD